MFWLLIGLTLYVLLVLSEQVILAVSPHDLEVLRADSVQSASARRAFHLATTQVKTSLAALSISRLLVKIIFAGGLAIWLMRNPDWRQWLHDWALQWHIAPFWLWFAGVMVIAAALALVFGLNHRLIDTQSDRFQPRAWLQRLSHFIRFWTVLFKPFIKKHPITSQEALIQEAVNSASTPVSTSDEEISSEKRDIELMKSIVKFGDVTVKQVMQPRSKIIGADFAIHYHELLDLLRESGFSRMPVYQDDLDNITGMLYVKDLVPFLDEGPGFEWQSQVRTEIMIVPESKRISELLRDFKQKKRHIAIVVDEYGGTSGIVTMEDILEEITGEIHDEFDDESDEAPPYVQIDAHHFLFDGAMLLNDVCRICGLTPGTFDAIRDDADTLAGLILHLHGDIPAQNDVIEWEDYKFTITSADNRRIVQVKMAIGA